MQPHHIESFFRKSCAKLGGRMSSREQGRHEIGHVPAALRNRASHDPVLRCYACVCFDKRFRESKIVAYLICPWHPLLDTVIDAMRERVAALLKRGAILLSRMTRARNAAFSFILNPTFRMAKFCQTGVAEKFPAKSIWWS